MDEVNRAEAADENVHLYIHAPVNDPADTGFVASVVRSLLSLVPGRETTEPGQRTQVRIENLQGQPLRSWDDVGSLLDVPLRAGVYRVTVSHGAQTRRYTVSMNAGEAVDLHVRLPQGAGNGH